MKERRPLCYRQQKDMQLHLSPELRIAIPLIRLQYRFIEGQPHHHYHHLHHANYITLITEVIYSLSQN